MAGPLAWATLLVLGLAFAILARGRRPEDLDAYSRLLRRSAWASSLVAPLPGIAVMAMAVDDPLGSLWWLAYLFASFPVLFWGRAIIAYRFASSPSETEMTPDDLAFVGRVFKAVDDELARRGVPFEHQHPDGVYQAWLCRLGEGPLALHISSCRMQEVELLASVSKPLGTSVAREPVVGDGLDYKLPLREHVRLAMLRPGLVRKLQHLLRGRRSEGRDWITVAAEQRAAFLVLFPPRIAAFVVETPGISSGGGSSVGSGKR